jgi:hypothetical protein
VEEPLLRVRYELEEEDVIALHLRMFRESDLLKETYARNWKNGIVAGLLVSGLLATVNYYMAKDPHHAAITAGLTLVLFWTIAWPIYAFRTLTRRAFDRKMQAMAERMVRERKVPVELGEAELLVYPEQLVWNDRRADREAMGIGLACH